MCGKSNALYPDKRTDHAYSDRFTAQMREDHPSSGYHPADEQRLGDISGVTVGVVDERSELAGCYQGIPQNDLGMRTDILDGCPKAEGMQMLIRSMSPVVVAVDELGKEEDFKAVESVIHCGCRLIATAHGDSMKETLSQPFFRKLWDARVFQRYIFLGKHDRAGVVEGIYDGNGKCLCTEL